MRRYLLIRIYSEAPTVFTGEQFMEALMGSVRKYFGEFGASKIEPRMLRFDPHKAEVIIACHKDREKELQAAVALITDIANLPVAALTLQISGTIRSLSTRQ